MPSSKLSRYTEALMEAVWLAALIVVPVFFNVYSSRIFEPDKIALMRSLALIGLGAWIVRLIEQGGVDWGESRAAGEGWLRALLRIPLLPAVLALAAVYLLATIFSVTPRISFWGSYQRLQGTYTMLSYLMVFGMVAANLRRREQVDRLVTAVILASLPVGLYGIIQKFEIDPVPWGGDTSQRVAANMGNAIFVAAYLIMAFPLTLGRIVDSFANILREDETNLAPQVARGTVYVFTAAIQLITIYFSLSRGPILGLLAGTFFMFVLLSLYWDKRWLTLTTVGLAGALGVFLLILSIPGGPLDSLRSNENIGRLGNVFQTEEGTGKVRVLIWQGAAQLTGFHQPIAFPDGTRDPVNFLRPFIGYGPESMYVAYNPFYPPELANIEARNASPDRSHNETWDALVITGWLGLAAEQAVFISVFFYGLKWLGLINTPRQRSLFFGLIFGGGAASAAAFILLVDPGFFGVGLPFGILLGLLAYLTLVAVFARYEAPATPGERARALALTMFLAAIIAHYVEIHFGIAIAATRLYFWTFAGVLLSVGCLMTRQGVYGETAQARFTGGALPGGDASAPSEPLPARKGKRRVAGSVPAAAGSHGWAGGVLAGLALVSLGFNYVTNSFRSLSVGEILRRSLSTLPNQDGMTSYGILAIFLTTLLAAAVVVTAEWAREQPAGWRKVLGAATGVMAAIWAVYMFLQANALIRIITAAQRLNDAETGVEIMVRQATALEGVITLFYLAVAGLVFWLARRLLPLDGHGGRDDLASGRGMAAALVTALAVLVLAWQANLRIIHADVAFKMAEPFANSSDPANLNVAILLYQRANDFAPSEDHYYLFLGRGYLELARLIAGQDPAQTAQLLRDAEQDLERAQTINPLNTDHTANLARLHRFWAGILQDPAAGADLLEEASTYYSHAVELSPQNVVIWNEWASLYMQLGDNTRALELLAHSLETDPQYFETYGMLGDFYLRESRRAPDDASRAEAVELAVGYFHDAIEHTRPDDASLRHTYLAAIAGVYVETGDLPQAVDYYLDALNYASDSQRWRLEDNIARLYAQMGHFAEALVYANRSLLDAPEEQKAAQQELVEQIQIQQTTP